MITVIFSSFNGSRTLETMLDSFMKLNAPTSGWKIIAVDNASTDATSDILRSYSEKLPLKIIYEKNQGKNHALNSALDHIEEGLIVFTDDDIVAHRDWLLELEKSAKEMTAYDLFGGRIIPRWPITPPDWLFFTGNIGMLFAITPHNNSRSIPTTDIWGPNMAVRSSLLIDGDIRFDVTVGPDGTGKYIMGSETDLLNRLGDFGALAWHSHSAVVEHIIRPEQVSRSWVLKRYFRFGRLAHREGHLGGADPIKFFGVDRWLFRSLLSEISKVLFGWLTLNTMIRVRAEEAVYFTFGQIYQARDDVRKQLRDAN